MAEYNALENMLLGEFFKCQKIYLLLGEIKEVSETCIKIEVVKLPVILLLPQYEKHGRLVSMTKLCITFLHNYLCPFNQTDAFLDKQNF